MRLDNLHLHLNWPQLSSIHPCPKMSTCLLRALLDKLLTRDKLKQFEIVEQNFSVLCNSEIETTHHLLLHSLCVSLNSSYPLIISAYTQK